MYILIYTYFENYLLLKNCVIDRLYAKMYTQIFKLRVVQTNK